MLKVPPAPMPPLSRGDCNFTAATGRCARCGSTAACSPSSATRRSGLQKDYLNRLVRRACGLTFGQWRSRELLRAAENELKRGSRVTATAESLGFIDPGYFGRWFRKQTGLPPSHWPPA